MRRFLARAAAGLPLAALTGWGALVLFYLAPGSPATREALAWGFGALGALAVVSLFAPRARRAAAIGWLAGAALVAFSWLGATPSNDRDWQPDVARLPWATVEGDLVHFHDVRNFDYESETEFTPAWYDRTYDLRRLEGVDLVAVYWMGPAIAHIFLSFDFGDSPLAISIEVRKERAEQYSSIAGFFRQYELTYVVADERDVIRLRTNYRKDPPEDVYVFRVTGAPENARRIFLDYVRRIDELHDHPAFYNTLTTNCTTTILTHSAVNPGHLPYSWKVLLSGYVPEYLYEHGRLAAKLPFDELFRRSRVNDAARAADQDPGFSRRIRASLP